MGDHCPSCGSDMFDSDTCPLCCRSIWDDEYDDDGEDDLEVQGYERPTRNYEAREVHQPRKKTFKDAVMALLGVAIAFVICYYTVSSML